MMKPGEKEAEHFAFVIDTQSGLKVFGHGNTLQVYLVGLASIDSMFYHTNKRSFQNTS